MPLRDQLSGAPRRRGEWSSSDKGKIAALSVVLGVLVVAALILYKMGQSSLTRTDPTTLCRVDHPPSSVTVILLDISDEFSEPQRLKIRNELDNLKPQISRFGLVEVYSVDRAGDRLTKPLLHLCNPGTGEDLSPYYQNPDLARKRWKGFSEQLDTEIARLTAVAGSPTSPILEAIQAIALRTFNVAEHRDLPKHLVVVSDLMQNTPTGLSHYEGIPTFEEFRQTPYFSDVRADLQGVTVTLLYLVRPRAPQKWPAHRRFWEEYFLTQQGVVNRVEPVYGTQ